MCPNHGVASRSHTFLHTSIPFLFPDGYHTWPFHQKWTKYDIANHSLSPNLNWNQLKPWFPIFTPSVVCGSQNQPSHEANDAAQPHIRAGGSRVDGFGGVLIPKICCCWLPPICCGHQSLKARGKQIVFFLSCSVTFGPFLGMLGGRALYCAGHVLKPDSVAPPVLFKGTTPMKAIVTAMSVWWAC